MHSDPYLNQAMDAARRVDRKALYALAHDIFIAWQQGKTVFTCGNGGSYSAAQHLAQDLEKGTWAPLQKRLKTYHLGGNPSALTAWANDKDYSRVFSADLGPCGQQGDLLIAISGSGNSPNVLDAVRVAHASEMRAWGVTGFSGGTLGEIADRHLNVPSGNMGIVESVHGILFHWLVDYLIWAFKASMRQGLDELTAWVPVP